MDGLFLHMSAPQISKLLPHTCIQGWLLYYKPDAVVFSKGFAIVGLNNLSVIFFGNPLTLCRYIQMADQIYPRTGGRQQLRTFMVCKLPTCYLLMFLVSNFPFVMVHGYTLTLFQQKPNCSCYITISSKAPWQLGRIKSC
jgi:hypothetical protein